jgi:hypothetical protein
MKKIFGFLLVIAALQTHAQNVTRSELVGMWHLDRMIQDSVCVLDINDSMVLINRVFAYSKKVNQEFTRKDSLAILEQCRKKNKDMRSVFIQFHKNGTCQNRKIKPGINGGITDSIETGKYVFHKEKQTIEYSGSPEMSVSISKGRLRLGFTVGLMMKPQEVVMEYVKW